MNVEHDTLKIHTVNPRVTTRNIKDIFYKDNKPLKEIKCNIKITQIILNTQEKRNKEQITEGKIENKLPNDRAKPNHINNHIKCKW